MDRSDFRALYERYAGDVQRFAFYLCADRSRAEDIAAEAFARAWTGTGEIRTATVKAFLFAIVRNLVREDARKRGREVGPLGGQSGSGPRGPVRGRGGSMDEEMQEGIADSRPGPAASADGRFELRAVLAALQQLPEADRAALLMRAQDGMSHQEIAAALGLSVAAVRVRIHRARLELNARKIREERRT
jgi:RNA polymerase sigma-70 factor (ECF subfamily)